jgi:micrococcal nuclease
MYTYRAVVVSAYDGDTIRVDIDLGFGIWFRNQPMRLARIDTPEMRGADKVAGTIARDFLRERILGQEVTIKTSKDKAGKYGRYIAEVIHKGENINNLLVKEGYARYYE